MANVTVIAVSAISGVPLFIRHRGNGKPPSYNIIGSLNGVLMFGDSQGTKLISSCTPNTTVTWKTYHDSIRLIMLHRQHTPVQSPRATSKLGTHSDHQFLDLVFNSLVLLLSIDALTGNINVDRLKRDVKVCFPLLDTLLERFENSSSPSSHSIGGPGPLFSHLVQCTDTVLPPDHYNLQSEVQKWSEGHCNSSYSCLISANSRVLAASRTYWTLSATELVLLPMLLLSAPVPNTAKDVPVYLPNKSPKVPFRLLSIKLTCHVWCVALCGPSPSLASLIKSASLFWGPYYASMETLAATQPYNMTASARQALDKAVLGLLLVSHDTKRCISCVHLGSTSKNPHSSKKTSPSKSPSSSTPAPPSNTSTLSSLQADGAKSNYPQNTSTLNSESKISNVRAAQSPPQTTSHTSTLKSSAGKSSKVHHYQRVECNISPVRNMTGKKTKGGQERATSPVGRALSPTSSSNKNTMSSSQNSSLNRQSRALSRTSNQTTPRVLSPNGYRSPSPHASINGVKSISSGVAPIPQPLSPNFKVSALAAVYRALIGNILQTSTTDDYSASPLNIADGHRITEAYIWCGSCRVYVLQSSSLHLLVLLPSALPHTLARSVTYKTLDIFQKAKAFKI